MTKPRPTPFVIAALLFGVFASLLADGGGLNSQAVAQSELRFVQPSISKTTSDTLATTPTAPVPNQVVAPQSVSPQSFPSVPLRTVPVTTPNPLRFRTPDTGKPSVPSIPPTASPVIQGTDNRQIREILAETILPAPGADSSTSSATPLLPLLETHPLPTQGTNLPVMPILSTPTTETALPAIPPNASAEPVPGNTQSSFARDAAVKSDPAKGSAKRSPGPENIDAEPEMPPMLPLLPQTLPALVLPTPVDAATAPTSPQMRELVAESEDPRIKDILRGAETMEKEARWSELLAYYESALKTHRDHPLLLRKYRSARSHYDIICRYYDSSFASLLLSARVEDNLVLFDEVIDKIQESHIDAPHWNDLFYSGLKDLQIALTESVFLQKHQLDAKAPQITQFERELQAMIAPWEVGSREDLRNAVLHVTYLAQKTLGINASAVLLEFICGVANSLDPHTAFLTKNQLNDTFSTINGDLVGLGVELKSDQHSLYIFRVISGGPAQEAGLRGGDRILTVDGKPTQGLDTNRAADMLLGEVNTPIRLLVQSPSSQPRYLDVRRRHIKVPSVEDVKMLNDHLGYLKLNCFQSTTTAEMREALWNLHSQGMRCLVVDLRHNPGGLLLVSIEVANLFLEKGVIVTTRVHPQDPGTPYMATATGTWRTPLVVLIDEDSASASEVFAGAIRDHGRGVIVGRRSYGKGTVQLVHRLKGVGKNGDIAGLRLTVEKFYSPDGISCSTIGVDPDIMVEPGQAQRQMVARPVDGQIPARSTEPFSSQTPLALAPSSAPNDPYIVKAIETAREMLTTARRPRSESQ